MLGEQGTRRRAGGAQGAQQAHAARRGARGHGLGLGLPLRRLSMLAGSVGQVWVFGAPDSL